MKNEFWEHLDHLVTSNQVVIDRSRGSTHPRDKNIVYPLDYGYLKGIFSGDGGDLDVWVGSNAEKKIDGFICTADLNKRDVEVKILIGCSETGVQTIMDFHNSGSMGALLIKPEGFFNDG
jgi:inorganic pyrophosphatase